MIRPASKQSVFIDDLLLGEPNDARAETILKRVRHAMQEAASRLAPGRVICVVGLIQANRLAPETGFERPESAVIVDWMAIESPVRAFSIALAQWGKNALHDAEAVRTAAQFLLDGWGEAVRRALLRERSAQVPSESTRTVTCEMAEVDTPSVNSREYGVRAALYSLVLIGVIIDTGTKRDGLTVWATPAGALSGAH